MAPSLLPVTVLTLMIPLNTCTATRERRAIDWGGACWVSAGRLVGTAGRFAVLVTVPTHALNLLIGATTLLAVLASLAAPTFTPGRRTQVIAGTLTGITETATGVGGPPLVRLYQHRPAPVLRSTVALCFLIGETLSLPAVGIGALASQNLHHRFSGPHLRIAVLTFALASATALLLRS